MEISRYKMIWKLSTPETQLKFSLQKSNFRILPKYAYRYFEKYWKTQYSHYPQIVISQKETKL